MIGADRDLEKATVRHWGLLGLIFLLGASLRFWGLDSIGLHGDEETMGLAVKGMLDTGSPVLPSGMYYGRGLLNTYLMAGSAYVFGLSEWALRLPSVIAGTIMVAASFFLGKRFLSPSWSLVFALILAILPAMISVSQTARMYVFYLTFLVIFVAMVFRWERTQSVFDFVVALIVFVLALHFQVLSVFSSLLFFLPGMLKKSPRIFLLGALAFAVCMGAYEFESTRSGSHYFDTVYFDIAVEDVALTNVVSIGPFKVPVFSVFSAGVLLVFASMISVFAMKDLNSAAPPMEKTGVAVAWVFAIICAAGMQYHLASLFFAAGTVLFLRCRGYSKWPVILGCIILIFAMTQIHDLWPIHGFDDTKKIIMTMVGAPNPWPYLRFAAFFPIAIFGYCVIFLNFIILFVRAEPGPDHVVFMLVAVWAPLFLIGFFDGHIPLRYSIGFVPFFILAFLAGLRDICKRQLKIPVDYPPFVVIIALLVLFAFIRPAELWHNVNPQYSDFPALSDGRGTDHKGAAEFVRSLDLDPADIVMAEDILQQTYYLGKVDYWLRLFTQYTYLRGDIYADIYTGTHHVGNAAMLKDLLDQRDRGAIYIIGSGETSRLPDYYLGKDMLELLRRASPEVLYVGRDGVTKVLRISAPPIG